MAANVFTTRNFSLAPAPAAYFVPDATGYSIPAGHTSWQLVIDTTGLPAGQQLMNVTVQYHYTNAMLNDGTGTLHPFTGWIDDCGGPLNTTFTSKTGTTVHQANIGCDLNRIPNYYPDFGRLQINSSPGYANIASATLNLI